MAEWTITALETGTSELDKSVGLYLTDCGTQITIPNIVFVIQGPQTIVVDTSFESVERTWQVHHQKVHRTPEQEVPAALERIGVDPAEVKIVVLTHLHYDHCGNNHLFPKARFFVQRRELEYAFVPLPGEETAYFSPLIGEKPSFLGTTFEIIEGDVDIADGIRLVPAPGHTPGCQAVLVQTGGEVYCVAGDAVFFYENLTRGIPPGATYSRADAIRSMEKLQRLADHIIPGHDPAIFRRQPARWPSASENV